MALVDPTTLQYILRNESFLLPENYELIAGTRKDNIYLYYDLNKVALVGNVHGVKLIMRVPIKTAQQPFTVHKLVALPARISKDKFVKYQPEYSYLGISLSQRNYFLMKKGDLQKCTTGSLVVCPANLALYDTQTLTCEAILYFQKSGIDNLCRRNLLVGYHTPTLQKHGAIWVYHFPVARPITFRCPHGTGCRTYNEVLTGTSTFHQATTCAIDARKLRTLPELHGMAIPPRMYLSCPHFSNQRDVPGRESWPNGNCANQRNKGTNRGPTQST
jgi:hypothetical protein